MNLFTLIAVVILIFGLIKDYKKDKGLNKKAKIYHSILLTLLLANYAGSFSILGWLVRNFEKANIKFGTSVGVFPGNVHLIIFYLNTFLSLIVLVYAYQMINRKENARKMLLLFLPPLALTSVFNFYRGWLNTNEEIILNDYSIIIIGGLLFGAITTVYLKVYNSEYMREFFSFEQVKANEVEPDIKDI